MGLAEVVGVASALAALAGVILGFMKFVSSRAERRRRVSVKLSMIALGTEPEITWALMISAVNPGPRVVTLDGVGLDLPQGKWLTFIKPQADGRLPYELVEGKRFQVWGPTRDIAAELKQSGFSGTVKVAAVAKDVLGTRYLSKRMKFNVDEWL